MRIGVLLLAVALAINGQRIDAPSGYCSGTIGDAWVDVVFMVDSSAAMTSNGLKSAEAYIKSVIRKMKIGDDSFKSSRYGVITYADEATTVRELTDDYADPPKLQYSGAHESNLLFAFQLAEEIFKSAESENTRQKVIVIIASTYREGGLFDARSKAAEFDGTIITISHSPSGFANSRLASIATDGFSFTTGDDEVANLFHAILHVNCFCEGDMFPMSHSPQGSPEGMCAELWTTALDQEFSADFCRTIGTTIVKIGSQEEQDILDAQTSSTYWIGLKHDEISDKFRWTDGEEPIFTSWADGQPKKEIGDCVYSKAGFWYSAACDGSSENSYHPTFCSLAPCSASNDCFNPTPDDHTDPPLEDTTTAGPTKCLSNGRIVPVTWERAAKNCTDDSTNLLIVRSESDHKRFNAMTTKAFWLGLRYSNDSGLFHWVDDTPLAFQYWSPGQPQMSQGECVYNKDSAWYTAACDGGEHGEDANVFWCEKDC